MARKQVILEIDDTDLSVYGRDGVMMWHWGVEGPDNMYQHFGDVNDLVTAAPVEKIVYRDADPKPCPRLHTEDIGGKINPEPIRHAPEQSGVSDLIRLKESGFTVDDILQLRADHLI